MGETNTHTSGKKIRVERVQTGVRLEKRMLKVLKALAEYLDMSLGDLLEGIVLHAFDGNPSPLNADLLQRVEALKQVYDMDYDSSVAHQFEEIA
jgi:predicted DNA-binding ribbon-helix-helix protein